MEDEIKYIDNEKLEKKEIINNNELEETIDSKFVIGLPDWDLEPPHEIIRRKKDDIL